MRKLTKAECKLIQFLLEGNPKNRNLINRLVEEMDDGGMGSLRFITEDVSEKRFGTQISEVTLLDQDNIPVSFAIFLDSGGDLFEINVFKADFSKLIRIPSPPYKPLT